tara:strand:+ start:35 stop:217 length:183 start_codon:yes stop_codon:yes gene_type:complete
MKVGDLVEPAYDKHGNPYCEYFKVALVIGFDRDGDPLLWLSGEGRPEFKRYVQVIKESKR